MASTPPSFTRELAQLKQQAIARFGQQCLWNLKPTDDLAGLQTIVRRLKGYGGLDALRLAEKIEIELKNAR